MTSNEKYRNLINRLQYLRTAMAEIEMTDGIASSLREQQLAALQSEYAAAMATADTYLAELRRENELRDNENRRRMAVNLKAAEVAVQPAAPLAGFAIAEALVPKRGRRITNSNGITHQEYGVDRSVVVDAQTELKQAHEKLAAAPKSVFGDSKEYEEVQQNIDVLLKRVDDSLHQSSVVSFALLHKAQLGYESALRHCDSFLERQKRRGNLNVDGKLLADPESRSGKRILAIQHTAELCKLSVEKFKKIMGEENPEIQAMRATVNRMEPEELGEYLKAMHRTLSDSMDCRRISEYIGYLRIIDERIEEQQWKPEDLKVSRQELTDFYKNLDRCEEVAAQVSALRQLPPELQEKNLDLLQAALDAQRAASQNSAALAAEQKQLLQELEHLTQAPLPGQAAVPSHQKADEKQLSDAVYAAIVENPGPLEKDIKQLLLEKDPDKLLRARHQFARDYVTPIVKTLQKDDPEQTGLAGIILEDPTSPKAAKIIKSGLEQLAAHKAQAAQKAAEKAPSIAPAKPVQRAATEKKREPPTLTNK